VREPRAARLTDLDIAIGFPLGGSPVDLPEPQGTARLVLEASIREALHRPPCVVTFSGGRDSSAILALALRIARAEGLPEPIAVTRVHPGVAATDETKWQEGVVEHLGVTEWERLSFDDEMDLLGPLGTRILRRFGVTWPPFIHTMLPPLELARGGSLITGEGGDEILGERRGSVLARLRMGRLRPGRTALRQLAVALGPRRLRRRRFYDAWGTDRRVQWLSETVRDRAIEQLLAAALDEPLQWVASSEWELGQRKRTEGARTYRVLGEDSDVAIVHPLLDPMFVSTLRNEAGTFGFCCRGCAMSAIFGDLLPPAVLYRRSKADFTQTLFHETTRAFMSTFAGPHPLEGTVRTDALLREASRPDPHPGIVLLVQHAWLAQADGERP
jgi:hypothetical protein